MKIKYKILLILIIGVLSYFAGYQCLDAIKTIFDFLLCMTIGFIIVAVCVILFILGVIYSEKLFHYKW